MTVATVDDMSSAKTRTPTTLTVAPVFQQFVDDDLLPVIGMSPGDFWPGLESLISDLTPLNRALLEKRAAMQAAINEWHAARSGEAWDHEAYVGFLHEQEHPAIAASQYGVGIRRGTPSQLVRHVGLVTHELFLEEEAVERGHRAIVHDDGAEQGSGRRGDPKGRVGGPNGESRGQYADVAVGDRLVLKDELGGAPNLALP